VKPSPAAERNPVGSHVKVGRGLVEAFRAACVDSGIRVWVHAPYLVNLGSPTPATYERSVASVAHNLARTAALGAEGVVVHTGSCIDEGSLAPAMRQVREGLLPVLDALAGDSPWLLLEPTAGQGRSLCAGVEDLAAYLDALDRLVEVAGAGRLRLVHANDSKDVRGSSRDRHERIGDGHIGTGAFTELLEHPSTEGVPLVLETPGSGEPASPCLPLLQKLRDAAGAR